MSQQTQETLLSDLCVICHVNLIKYTCPRCGIHTCSSPCVKRHKTWAQCSGIRDPAEYRKRNELATPSSIDKDFNFITKVERSIQHADSTAADRGIHLAPARSRFTTGPRPRHELEIEERNITVIKAPKGLSRSRQNKSHWANQHKCLMWTIEWIQHDGERIVGNGLEIRTVGEAYVNAVGKRNIRRKRKADEHDLDFGDLPSEKSSELTDSVPPTTTSTSSGQDPILKKTELDPDGDLPDQPDPKQDEKLGSVPASDTSKTDHTLLQGLYFYLHRPNTTANFKGLIPISGSSTVREVLTEKTILEFPTIFIMFESPDKLVEPYITEEEYLTRHDDDVPVNIGAQLEDGEIENETDGLPDKIDEQKVLEVLARDLAS